MRETTYSNPFRYRGATCPTVLLRCVDPRFHGALEAALPAWLVEMSGSAAFASMALPGGARALLDPVAQPVVLEALDTAVRTLECHRLLIVNHVDCRAYGGSETLGSPAEEEAFHIAQLRQARQIVRAAYPRLDIALLYQNWDTIREIVDWMTSPRRSRILDTALGFTGLGGMRWIASVLSDRRPGQPEDLTPADVLEPGARHIRVQGQLVAIREAGAGDPALVFIHGFAEHLDIWRPIQERLAQNHRTVALDLWGFGASARPTGMHQRDWVAQVTGVMDELGIERAVLVGHSLGGRVSLMAARAHPERVAGLVLADADWGQAPHGYVILSLLSHVPAVPLLMSRLRSNPAHLQRVIALIATPNHKWSPQAVEGLSRPLRVRGTAATWHQLGRTRVPADVRGLVDHVSCPSCVVWGADDPVVPLWAGQKLAHKLNCPIQVFNNCGHFAPEEYPEETVAVLEQFLASLPS